MNPQEKQEMERLKREVEDLKRKLDAVSSPNLSPDYVRNLVQAGFLRYDGTDVLTYTNPRGKDFRSLFFQFNNLRGAISYEQQENFFLIEDINLSTNTFTIMGHPFSDTNQCTIATTDTPPAPLTPQTIYFIRDATANTFKLAATSGGAAIDITTIGTGKRFVRGI